MTKRHLITKTILGFAFCPWNLVVLKAPFAVCVFWFALNIISKSIFLLSCPEATRKKNARRQAGGLSDRPAVGLLLLCAVRFLCAPPALVSLRSHLKQLSTVQASQQVFNDMVRSWCGVAYPEDLIILPPSSWNHSQCDQELSSDARVYIHGFIVLMLLPWTASEVWQRHHTGQFIHFYDPRLSVCLLAGRRHLLILRRSQAWHQRAVSLEAGRFVDFQSTDIDSEQEFLKLGVVRKIDASWRRVVIKSSPSAACAGSNEWTLHWKDSVGQGWGRRILQVL
jgi:hypothetical protein